MDYSPVQTQSQAPPQSQWHSGVGGSKRHLQKYLLHWQLRWLSEEAQFEGTDTWLLLLYCTSHTPSCSTHARASVAFHNMNQSIPLSLYVVYQEWTTILVGWLKGLLIAQTFARLFNDSRIPSLSAQYDS